MGCDVLAINLQSRSSLNTLAFYLSLRLIRASFKHSFGWPDTSMLESHYVWWWYRHDPCVQLRSGHIEEDSKCVVYDWTQNDCFLLWNFPILLTFGLIFQHIKDLVPSHMPLTSLSTLHLAAHWRVLGNNAPSRYNHAPEKGHYRLYVMSHTMMGAGGLKTGSAEDVQVNPALSTLQSHSVRCQSTGYVAEFPV